MTTPAELYGRPWSEPDYIIVLNQYFLHRHESAHTGCDHVKEVAQAIGRTPAAVAMRMENFASIDPEISQRSGLSHINALGRRIFQDWSSDTDAIKKCADTLLRDIRARNVPTLFNPHPIRIPKAFDRYELVDQIGEGGSGVVFSCVAVDTQEVFAIKIIKAEHMHDPEALHRFHREIRALKSIEHPNIIRLHEDNLESERNFPAFVMDHAVHSLTSYAEEISRGCAIRQRPVVDRATAITIMQSMLRAICRLNANHPRVIHRDLNPNNVLLLKDGTWVVADFGLAKFLRTAPVSTSFQTTTQRGWGTGWYTAPEQYRSFTEADQTADIYSLGMLLWELFTTDSPPPHHAHLGLSGPLIEIWTRATERNPADRYHSVDEFRTAFDVAIG